MDAEDPGSTTAVGIIGTVARILLVAVVVLVALASVGFDVNAIVAGLGIGGIAIALAAQNTIENFIGSLNFVTEYSLVKFFNFGHRSNPLASTTPW